MTAKRLAKSRDFFARRALAAGEAGNRNEAIRLQTCAIRKGTLAKLAAL